jgi:NTP pyrophosphatase (non-canonical NTP hydrolase)
MNKMELLRQANNARHKVWPGSRSGAEAVPFSAIEFAGEVGELLYSAVKNIAEADEARDTENMENMQDEIGDVIISMDLLARDLGISLDDVVFSAQKPDGEYDASYTFLFAFTAIGSTLAKILDPVKKLMRAQLGIAGNRAGVTEEELRQQIKDGMSILVFWISILTSLGELDVEYCVARKFNRTSRKNNIACYMDLDTWVWFHSTAMPEEHT